MKARFPSCSASLLVMITGCGSTKSSPPLTFATDASPPTDAGLPRDAKAPRDAAPKCAFPPGDTLDAGAKTVGIVSLSLAASTTTFTANFGAVATTPSGCLGPPLNQGGCCVGLSGLFEFVSAPAAGSINAAIDGGSYANLNPGSDGFYSSLAYGQLDAAGATLQMTAPGGTFPGFALSTTVPNAVTNVRGPWIPNGVDAAAFDLDAGATISLGQDIVLTWSPPAYTDVFTFVLYQLTGAPGCAVEQATFSLAVPLDIVCNVPSSPGTLTIPSELLSQAYFTPGTQGLVLIYGTNQAFAALPLEGAPEEGVRDGAAHDQVQVLVQSLGASIPIVFGR